MNILDENVLEGQRRLLANWRIPFLLRVRQQTFFTIDHHFYKPLLCHERYCLAYLDVSQSEAASFIRRLLRHPEFDTKSKRMGAVIRVSHSGLSVFRVHSEQEIRFQWRD